MEQTKLNDLSGWLTVLPMSQDHFDLTAQEFFDALALRYRKPLLNVPSNCDGCGSLSVTWERYYGEVIRWLRACLAIALVWVTNVCIQGSRTKWRSLGGLEDGAAVPIG